MYPLTSLPLHEGPVGFRSERDGSRLSVSCACQMISGPYSPYYVTRTASAIELQTSPGQPDCVVENARVKDDIKVEEIPSIIDQL
ncbi:hypothetical protein SCLCIDRAFT_1223435 [Scleroderma citrinum Foug A]|uniref:Uncharacterized protein n=1 Tax=Scleroderma citrinum Foug A TaxID=1036808 RepID=A0A0C3D9L4_9AGAM|nr:hypothetical protein SCLCIDRAFT_1223435 [Scleroderma citrinum Foug A]